MKLSISNIAWPANQDQQLYKFMQSMGFAGLEIAPTRIFTESPYQKIPEAKAFADELKRDFGLAISSMQSICFGCDEAIFGTEEERETISNYIKESIDFAAAINCKNLVFGSPKNRIIGENQQGIALTFFKDLGDYAASKNTILAFEPNPDIYGTNFINTTQEAVDFVKQVNSVGLKVNLDFGTFLYNKEQFEVIADHIDLIHHVHISEPYLEKIQVHDEHLQLAALLREKQYANYVSIEMKNLGNTESVKEVMAYTKQLFDAV